VSQTGFIFSSTLDCKTKVSCKLSNGRWTWWGWGQLPSLLSHQLIDDSSGIKILRCCVMPRIELGGSWLGTGASDGGSGMAIGMVIGCRSRAMANFQLCIICSILSSVWST